MKSFHRVVIGLACGAIAAHAAVKVDHEEFVGPFPSWNNVKTFGAVGDGQADDTAALQKALDNFGNARVLYLPAGTYRLTKSLVMTAIGNVQIIGEDPATTILKWDGPAGDEEAMLSCNGVYYSKFARITWNGGGKNITAVYHRWDQEKGGVGTGNEHADEVFVDVALGIRAGKPNVHKMDAETSVLRCKFLRCAVAGVRIQSFNALDWFIWDSEFDDCAVGITNDPGAGHFHAYRNIFRRSKVADVTLRNAGYFGIRWNLSLDSNRFFEGRDIGGWAVQTMLQGNTVLEPKETVAILVGNVGPALLVDNVVKSRADVTNGPVVKLDGGMEGEFVAVGNTFTVPEPFAARGQFLELATATKTAKEITAPELPGAVTPPNKNRLVIEMTNAVSGASIQAAVQQALKHKGRRPVIHFLVGTHGVDQTVTVPAGLDVQFAGDDGFEATRLRWTGATNGVMFKVEGPSRATFRDLQLDGGPYPCTGMVITKADQPGARLFGDGLGVNGNRGVGLLVDGLEQADLSFRSFYHQGNQLSVKVVGSAKAAAGQRVPARTVLFGGASSNNQFSYDVARGGRLTVYDTWYEGAPATFLKLAGAGLFTMCGAQIAPGRPGPNAAPDDPTFAGVALENFKGRASFLGVGFGTRVVVAGDGADTNVLLLGAHLQGNRDNLFPSPPPKAKVVMNFSTRYAGQEEGFPPCRIVPDFGQADAAWLLAMLEQVRADTPRLLTPLPANVTDLRFYRLQVGGFADGMRVERE